VEDLVPLVDGEEEDLREDFREEDPFLRTLLLLPAVLGLPLPFPLVAVLVLFPPLLCREVRLAVSVVGSLVALPMVDVPSNVDVPSGEMT